MEKIPVKSDNKFIMFGEKIDVRIFDGLDDYKIIKSKELKNEIIFGYKTKMDMPGIVMFSNEGGLEDNNNLRFGCVDIGFYPGRQYYKIKLNNYSIT